MNKLWYIQTVLLYSTILGNEIWSHGKTEEPQIHITTWKESENAVYCVTPSMTFWRKQNYRDNKKTSGCWEWAWEAGWLSWAQDFQGTGWHCNGGYMTLYIFEIHRMSQHQEWHQCRLWMLGGGNISVQVHQLKQMYHLVGALIMGVAVGVGRISTFHSFFQWTKNCSKKWTF